MSNVGFFVFVLVMTVWGTNTRSPSGWFRRMVTHVLGARGTGNNVRSGLKTHSGGVLSHVSWSGVFFL